MNFRTFVTRYGWIVALVAVVAVVGFFLVRAVQNSGPADAKNALPTAAVVFPVSNGESKVYDANGCPVYETATFAGFNPDGTCHYTMADGTTYDEAPVKYSAPLATPMAILPAATPGAEVARAAAPTLTVSVNEDNYAADIVMVALPGDMKAWVEAQAYNGPDACDPKTYSQNAWWIESTSKDGSNFDGGNGATWDIGLYDISKWSRTETLLAWGDEVTVDGVSYGQSLVAVSGGRHELHVQNGGYRIGLDMGGYMPMYWGKVLNCLYPHAAWTPVIVPAK